MLLADCPGWPLLSSITSDEQLLKCDKCPRCFCSEINRNRHFHVEHKSKNHDQDSANTRRLALGEFWAGLSDEEKKSVLSFEEVQLKVFFFISIIFLMMWDSSNTWRFAFVEFWDGVSYCFLLPSCY